MFDFGRWFVGDRRTSRGDNRDGQDSFQPPRRGTMTRHDDHLPNGATYFLTNQTLAVGSVLKNFSSSCVTFSWPLGPGCVPSPPKSCFFQTRSSPSRPLTPS